MRRLLIAATLGLLTVLFEPAQASQTILTDLLNQPINTDQGGGNQHQGTNIYTGIASPSGSPYFGTSVDLARITVQRSAFNGESYILVWQGAVVKNQQPPPTAVKIPGSDTLLSNPPIFTFDFSALFLNGTIPPPLASNSLATPTIYSIAVIEIGSNGKPSTETSAQFGFPYLNSQGQNLFKLGTQLGN
jgi:hypothetical protein